MHHSLDASTAGANSLDGIKAVLAKLLGEGHEISLDEGDLIGESSASGVLAGTADLELAVEKYKREYGQLQVLRIADN